MLRFRSGVAAQVNCPNAENFENARSFADRFPVYKLMKFSSSSGSLQYMSCSCATELFPKTLSIPAVMIVVPVVSLKYSRGRNHDPSPLNESDPIDPDQPAPATMSELFEYPARNWIS